MKKEYDVTLPEFTRGGRQGGRTEEYQAILTFLKGTRDNLCFTYLTNKEASRRRASLAVSVKRDNLPVILRTYQNRIFVLRKEN